MAKWTRIPMAPWLPDQAPFDNPGMTVATNVIPLTQTSYGPVAALAGQGAALDARCQGAVSVIDNGGNNDIIAGDVDKLYRVLSDGTAADISKAGGYTTASDAQWHFAVSNGLLIATNGTDPLQSMAVGGAEFDDLSGDAPTARYCADVKGFLMVGNTFDGVDGVRPQRVWWSALNDPTDWPTPGTASAQALQSDFNDFSGEWGWIQGLVGNLGTADVAIFMERGIWRGVFTGPPAVFSFFPALGAKGCAAPGSIVQLGNIAFYLGEDGFYAFDGSSARPVGDQKVDRTFFADFDPTYPDRVWGAVDPVGKRIFWSYPRLGDDGVPSRLLCYAYTLDRWSIIEESTETLLRALTFGYTLDGLDTLGQNLEQIQFSFDSRVWTGNQLLLAAFGPTHEFSYFQGQTLPAVVNTAEKDIGQGKRMMVRNARPLVEGGAPSIRVAMRDRLADTATWGPSTSLNAVGLCPQRVGGRYARAEIALPAAAEWTAIQGLELDVEPMGER